MPTGAPSRSDRLTLAALVLAGAAALAAPDRFLALAPPCLISWATGHPCWGCGSTRALVALLHLEPARAWALNPRAVLVAPILAFVALRLAWRVLRPVRR